VTEDVAVNFGCAICAGIISASIANPTDVLKVRLQALGRDKKGIFLGTNVFKCFRYIYIHEGLRGLWKVSILFLCMKVGPDYYTLILLESCYTLIFLINLQHTLLI